LGHLDLDKQEIGFVGCNSLAIFSEKNWESVGVNTAMDGWMERTMWFQLSEEFKGLESGAKIHEE
jgi:hypothetical protein